MSLSEGSKEYNLAEGVGSFYALLRNENLHPTIPIHYNNYIGRGDISIRSFLKGYKTADQLSDDFLALL
jgi:hypothetical protein